MKETSRLATFIISVQRHMEMDFGFQGKDYHMDFISDETDEIYIFEVTKGVKNGFEGRYESIRDLFQRCKIEGVIFEDVLYRLDYIYA